MEMPSTKHQGSTNLSEFPGELILEILQHLAVIRGYLPNAEEEATRQSENAQRVATLHALCLTCRRFNDIGTPFLYESITKLGQSTDWSRVDSLVTTITEKPALMDYVRYIETDGDNFDTHLGASLETRLGRIACIDYDAYDAEEITLDHFPCIIVMSTLISLARNLQSLAVDAIWHQEGVYQLQSNLALREISLRNLYSVGGSVYICALQTTRFSPVLMMLSRIANVRVGHTWLNRLMADEDWHNQGQELSMEKQLCRSELRSIPIEQLVLEGNIRNDAFAKLLSRCSFLRRLRCRWTAACDGRPGEAIDLRELRRGLQPFENTLEYLVLDTLDSSWLVELEEYIPAVGSLREFTNLKHIEVSGMVLWNDDNNTVEQPRLSSILPSALETLIVNVEWDDYVEEGLADLTKDCAIHCPNLNTVDCSWRPAPMFVGRDLISDFEKAGVKLKLDIASCTEEEETRLEAEMSQLEQDMVYMDKRAEEIEEEIRRFDEEVTQMEEQAHTEDALPSSST